MSLQVPNVSFRSSKCSLQEEDHEDDDDNLCISIEGFHGSEQYSVVSTSVKQSMRYEEGPHHYHLHPPPLLSPPIKVIPLNPPTLPPPKHHFISASLPGSATASPRSVGAGLPHIDNGIKKWRNHQADQQGASSLPIHHALSGSHQQTFGLSGSRVETHLLRSKSCGEGRASAPSDAFYLFSRKLCGRRSRRHHEGEHHIENNDDDKNKRKNVVRSGNKKKAANKDQYNYKPKNKKNERLHKFKYSALCLFLAGFGKGIKPLVRGRRNKDGEAVVVRDDHESRNIVISRTVSLGQFECGSWSSSAIINNDDVDHVVSEDSPPPPPPHHHLSSMHHQQHLYFDLPLELIQNCRTDANNFPVTTAFVFDSADRKGKGKGKGKMALIMLKKSSSRTSAAASKNKSHNQSSSGLHHHQVRLFTTTGSGSSQASCISPRLRKARDDFNAFLQQAQDAN